MSQLDWSFATIVFTYCVLVLIFSLQPYINAKMVLFGVYVPEENRSRLEVRSLRKRFLITGWIASIVVAAIVVSCRHVLNLERNEIMLILIAVQLLLFPLLYLQFRGNALRLKREQSWQAPVNSRRVASLSFPRRKSTIGNVWFIIPLLITGIFAVTAAIRWDEIPSTLVTHYDANGIADGFSNKDFGSVFQFNFIQVGLVLLFLFTNFSIRSSKQSLDPNNPEQSMIKQLRFRKITSISLFGLSTFIIFFIGIIQGSIIYDWPKSTIISAAIALPSILLAIIVAFSVYISRQKLDQHSDPIIKEDRYWKAGAFYYNPEDPALFVSKRTGFGWTLNYGRPLSWVVSIGILVIPLVILIFGVTHS
ncbi:DUF1648 domain-containing protein [Cohnella lupini]|uniref:Putative membrane protein n=1 Tax=Cohnella lupini TaxID=1294267 RepID=A0A3D9HQZ9_9BACL|nr:DUF5808 domain-containing protein [Cohnella lupini]RED51721.1 putative membrane protein [Cohnella lupini]